ncbi:MAG: DUF2752 domain-containing protein [Planctomycetota bacterium]|nr:MAG: DUF2752 domain-containing protein [Planctomycetota bacterium]
MDEDNSRIHAALGDETTVEQREAAWRAHDAAQAKRERRFWAGVVFVGCAAVLGLAAYLKPAPSGVGTHCQLGLGQCGMLATTGLPCPTCGMTTAFANTVRGRLGAAFLAQPTGMILALATMAALLLSAWTVVVGRLPRDGAWIPGPYATCLTLLVLLLGGWAFKIAMVLAS